MNYEYTYNRAWLLKRAESGQKQKYVFFWGHREKPEQVTKVCFSQWYSASFSVDGRRYPTSEHWMMAEKARLFGDMEIYEKVFSAGSPGAAKALGRQVSGFDANIWDAEKYEIVVEGNRYKFGQNLKLTEFLIGTGKRVIVEASPLDEIWGIGLAVEDDRVENPRKWKGENLLGFALMEVRDILSK